MKQLSRGAVTLFVIMLLTMVISCTSATTPNSNPAPVTRPTSTRHQRTNGTLTKINGNMLTLTTAQGQMTVITSDNTTIQNVTTNTISDLHTGEYLLALGAQDANGNISATSIIIRSQGTPPTPPNGPTLTSPRSANSGARHGASGTISQINGNVLTLTTAQGPVTVNIISDNTTIQNITTGTLSDLHEGQSLSITGQQDTNGNVTATSIMIRPQVQSTPTTPSSGL